MSKFARGTLIKHKVMGKGVVIDGTKEGMIKVRMGNGVVENFYPEELETEDAVQERNRRTTEEVVKLNKEKAKLWKI